MTNHTDGDNSEQADNPTTLICLECGHEFRDSELKHTYDDHYPSSKIEVCPRCGSIAWEEKTNCSDTQTE
jgi:uncharacterized protein with PIN domain